MNSEVLHWAEQTQAELSFLSHYLIVGVLKLTDVQRLDSACKMHL